MSYQRQSLGKKGEKLVLHYLESLGYTIRLQNFRTRLGEIDIIAEDNATLVFVEVKTRSGESFGRPLDSITRTKQIQLSKVALEYMGRQGNHDCPARFDVVGVVLAPLGEPSIELIKNAFDLCYGI